jgi:IS30 family transposase
MDKAVEVQNITDGNVRYYTDTELAELRRKGLSYSAIAKRTGIAKSTVHQRVVKYIDEVRRVAEFRANDADDHTRMRMRVRGHITDSKLEKTNAQGLAVIEAIYFDKERLLRGESTQNVSVFSRTIEAACATPDNKVLTDNTEKEESLQEVTEVEATEVTPEVTQNPQERQTGGGE